MPSSPLAYFITFSTYGAWLHGREIGSVDKQHNEAGTPFLPPDANKERDERTNMREPPYLLDGLGRTIVLRTVHACHVRTTHVHVIVTGDAKPEKIMSDLKAYASRRLKEQLNEPADRKRWTQHGSTVYLWNKQQLAEKIEYVLNRQGPRMAVYAPSEHDA